MTLIRLCADSNSEIVYYQQIYVIIRIAKINSYRYLKQGNVVEIARQFGSYQIRPTCLLVVNLLS